MRRRVPALTVLAVTVATVLGGCGGEFGGVYDLPLPGGADLGSHPNPLVTASFGLPFYLGFLSIGLIMTSLIVNGFVERRKTREMRGVGAIFTNNS